jgi:hypothetical protein
MLSLLIAAPLSDVAGREESAQTARPFAFDIPAQPLASALEAYSTLTGIEILYDSGLAAGRRSTDVQGTMPAGDALRTLLTGMSLSARLIAPDAVTIELPPASAHEDAEPAPQNSAHRVYYSRIQAGLEQAFCKDNQVRPGGYRALLKFTVAQDGRIRQPHVVGTTGSDERDRMIARTLDGVELGSPPPADLRQPIMMVILPQICGRAS